MNPDKRVRGYLDDQNGPLLSLTSETVYGSDVTLDEGVYPSTRPQRDSTDTLYPYNIPQ